MKWGVRRYQNKDGTLTAAGKKRFQQERAYQGKMNSKETEAYAKYRIKKRGALQALADERETLNRATERPVNVGGTAGALAGALAGATLGGPGGVAVGGVMGGIWGIVLSSAAAQPGLVKRGEQYVKNCDAIKRKAKIADMTVSEPGRNYNNNSNRNVVYRMQTDQAVIDGMRNASIGLSGGTNPFMFG